MVVSGDGTWSHSIAIVRSTIQRNGIFVRVTKRGV